MRGVSPATQAHTFILPNHRRTPNPSLAQPFSLCFAHSTISMSIEEYRRVTQSVCNALQGTLDRIGFTKSRMLDQWGKDISNAMDLHSVAMDSYFTRHAEPVRTKAFRIFSIMEDVFSEDKRHEWHTRLNTLRREPEPNTGEPRVSRPRLSLVCYCLHRA